MEVRVDSDGYPLDEDLEAIRTYAHSASSWLDSWDWLKETLSSYSGQVGYCSYIEEPWDGPWEHNGGLEQQKITFATCGWSGAEDLISAVTGNLIVSLLFYESWQRSGKYTFTCRRPRLVKEDS